ncbi:hypothetical protein [Agrobacterium cavarae]|uniref:hypothetical protein n=1 Tax=Agrobacterium cavarae TaxID=2528239 RepID=UPI0028A1389A|nr:hypothetical protein [Agrobacterium cavarae]
MAETARLVLVLGFHQTFERLPIKGNPLMDDVDAQGFIVDEKGKRKLENTEVDWVTYAPIHSPTASNTTERIRHLKPSGDLLESENAGKAEFMVKRWASIEPHYEAWKAGNAAPTHGTPLSVWPGVSTAMADELKKYTIRTVEEVRDIPESMLDRIRLPNMRALRSSAAAFLSNMEISQAAEREADRDQEMELLRQELQDQREQLAAAMSLLEEKSSAGPSDEDRKAQLRAQLDAKGIPYHHKAGLSTLQALLDDEAA